MRMNQFMGFYARSAHPFPQIAHIPIQTKCSNSVNQKISKLYTMFNISKSLKLSTMLKI